MVYESWFTCPSSRAARRAELLPPAANRRSRSLSAKPFGEYHAHKSARSRSFQNRNTLREFPELLSVLEALPSTFHYCEKPVMDEPESLRSKVAELMTAGAAA